MTMKELISRQVVLAEVAAWLDGLQDKHLIAILEEIPVENFHRWISVEERLPEENAEVLCCFKMQKGDAYYTLGVNYRNGWTFDNDPYAEHDQTVTHWMPLPELPKEE